MFGLPGSWALPVRVGIAFGITMMGVASADAAGSQPMLTGGLTSQPIGHYEFCKLNPAECSVRLRDTGPLHVTDATWKEIAAVNTLVNTTVRPMNDFDIYGKDEVWAYPTTAGDCEDFALLKRRMLIQRGFSAADLLMTVVRKPDGEGHAVLTLRTAEGDFVLDNLASDVKPWFATPYSFVKRQSSYNAGRWVTIENGRDVLVGALR